MRWIAVFAVSLAVLACGSTSTLPKSAQSPLLSGPLPEFRRNDLAGSTVNTKALGGNVVVVKFFAKYCVPCRKTLPATQALATERTDVRFIGVSVDESERDAREMVNQYGLSFPVVYDRGAVLAGRFRISELPATFVVGKSGNVVWVGTDAVDEVSLSAAIEAAATR
jgi:thiol-disulfide isomerase/thioredoxin